MTLNHHGLNRHRLAHSASRLEKVLADAWEETNNPPSFLNGGVGTLAWLVTSELVDRQVYGLGCDWVPRPELLTQRDAEVAASVIQWLGTHVGFSWLEETLKKGGWELKQRKEAHPNG